MNRSLPLAGPLVAIVFALLLMGHSNAVAAGDLSTVLAGDKTSWHGFDRYDFLMDVSTLAIKPIKAADDEKDGIRHQIDGQRRCILVVPREVAPGNPWSWRGVYWDHMPQTEIALLHRGFYIAYVESSATLRPDRCWDAWYAFLIQHGLSPKPVFIGMSRGGEFEYTWATAHPDEVSCIYADNPYLPPKILMKLGALATNDVPLLQVCGSLDPLLGTSATAVENIYQQFGGRVSMMIKEGYAHHPHSLRDPTPIVDFILQSVRETNGAPPAFVGGKFVKTSFYGTENIYTNNVEEGAYVTCRGPQFTACYDRYQFGIEGIPGAGVTIIAPKVPAPGNPWVFGSDFVARDATVDLALLAKGFYIVTGPVPYDVGPVLEQWNAAYKYLTDRGFSSKPVMEGAGAAAGEAYAWAIENPDKVSGIYGENPIMHSNLSNKPLLDNLDILAKAGIPLFSVCGSLDPGLTDNTRAIEDRYRKLGGQITVIIQDGDGHFPLAPKDPAPVVDFITKAALNGAAPGSSPRAM